ncbi:MAG: hypothetical protein WC957_02150 [Candidatus Neomarinimicrobiota bacterium]|jgi:hypothetical protein|nr:hypothetical protein [Candidatus Neomarinimicrobiota bacterium]
MNNNKIDSPEKQTTDFLKDEIFPLANMIPGIVHNISNPLTIIKIRSQILQNKMPDSPIFPALLDNINKIENILGNLAERISNLGNNEVRPINLKNLIKNELQFLEADMNFKHKVTKKIDLQESQPYIMAVHRHLSDGLLAALAALIRMMDSSDERILGISVFAQADLITLTLTATVNGLSAEEVRLFARLSQFQDAVTALSNRPSASPELQLLIRSFYSFKPYITDYSPSIAGDNLFKCTITFPLEK